MDVWLVKRAASGYDQPSQRMEISGVATILVVDEKLWLENSLVNYTAIDSDVARKARSGVAMI